MELLGPERRHDFTGGYEITGLSFPLTFPSLQPESISIEKLVLVPPKTGTDPIPFARLLQTFLDLPDSVPNTTITISNLAMPGAPDVDNLVWRSVEQAQHIVFRTHSIDVTIDVDIAQDGGHQIIGRAILGSSTDVSSLVIDTDTSQARPGSARVG